MAENVCKDTLALKLDENIFADWKREGAYFKGKISKIGTNLNYSIHYDDGDTEDNVPRKFIKSESYTSLQVGQKVLCNFQNSGIYYPGKVRSISLVGNKDPTEKEFVIDYDDGDEEKKVALDRIVPLEDGPSLIIGQNVLGKFKYLNFSSTFINCLLILANWKRLGHYYPGKIANVHLNDIFDVAYEDGEIEEKIPRYQIETL